ncbi:MAG TPA: phosphopantetheine-binding protein [Candidatus Eisenbacteria bacterium]|nr:phosphopantetheine-binding protein [Candidatus Eisenbacteria bacterium]
MTSDLHREIEQKIKHILAGELHVDPEVLAGSDSATPLLGRGIALDSVETTALVLGLEEAFRISIPDSEMTASVFDTIGTLTDYVAGKIDNGNAVGETAKDRR